jgi:nucleoside-diphosphate-sugar epimerase
MTSRDLVLITGGSGHIGYRVIVEALEAGYSVRAAVRSHAKAEKILAAPSIKALNPGDRLTFVEVPDLTEERAYDSAIQGAKYAIHVASPIPFSFPEGGDLKEYFVEPAVKGTMGLLWAAHKAGSVEGVVITSSVVAIIPWKDFTSGKSETTFDESSRIPTPSEYDNPFEAYAASKVAALNEAEEWVNKTHPSFSVVHIFPSYVLGKDELVIDKKDVCYGTNKEVLTPVTGGDAGFLLGASTHLEDVAKAHIRALDPSFVGSKGLILSADGIHGTRWEELKTIVAENFIDAVKSGTLVNNGKIATIPIKIDGRQSEKVLGFKFRSFEEQVTSVVAHYLELVENGQ